MAPVINFNEARAERLWRALVRAGDLPADIPRDPDVTLGDAWRGWCAWLGVDPDKPFDVEGVRARLEAAIDATWAEIDEIKEGGV
jgi:hypothetical protein